MNRIFRNILLYAIEAVVVCNLLLILALNIPYVQGKVGSMAADFLSDLLQTEVSVGRVDAGMLNQIIISDVEVRDRQHQPLLSIQRLTGKMDIFMLGKSQIAFNTIQLLHFQAHLNQPAADKPTNFQFIIDALSSDTPSETQTNVRINSLLVRDGEVFFDKTYLPKKDKLDTNHLHIQDLNAHISLKSILKDSIQVRLRQLSFREASGLDLRNINLNVEANQHEALISKLNINLPHSAAVLDTLKLHYDTQATDFLSQLKSSGQLSLEPLVLADLSCIVPKLKDFKDRIYADVQVEQNGHSIDIPALTISTEEHDLVLNTHATVQLPADSTQVIYATAGIDNLNIQPSAISMVFNNLKLGNVPSILERIGSIQYKGLLTASGRTLGVQGLWQTGVGQLDTDVDLTADRNLQGHIRTDNLNLGDLLADQKLGLLACDVQVDGLLANGKPVGKVVGTVPSVVYNNYEIRNIQIDGNLTANDAQGTVTIGDENLNIALEGSASLSQKMYDIQAHLQDLRPAVLGFQPDKNRAYTADINARFQGDNIDNLLGNIQVNNLSVQDTTEMYRMNMLRLNAANEDGQRRVSLYSDFMTAEVQGQYLYSTLPQSFIHVLEQYIPSLVNYKSSAVKAQNHFTFNVKLLDATLLNQLLNIPLELHEPVTLVGFFNDPANKLDIDMIAGSLDYNGSHYEQARVRCQNNEHAFLADANVNKFNKSSMITLGLHATAQDDLVNTAVSWNNNKDTGTFLGQLNVDARFNQMPGMPMQVGINVQPSDITLNDTTWHIRPARVDIQDKKYTVSNLTIESGERHLKVNGTVSDNPADSLIADLKDINVEYVLDAVNFHAVHFSGYASGKAYASNLLHDMQADTQLFIKDFRFEDGQMGHMNLYGRWENEDKAIYVNGHITEFGATDAPADSTQVWRSWNGLGDFVARTHVEGHISPKYNTIDLDIDAQNTNVAFLKGFVGTIFDNISGRATGWCHIGNTLKNIDLTAGLKASVNARVRSLNTTYTIQTDSVQLLTNHMRFINASITDRDGRQGRAWGDVYHDYLHRLVYDFHVQTDNLLCYETHDFSDDMPFYATAYAGGSISIAGQSGQLNINADVIANAGTTFVYDATIPEEVSNTQFITFVDKTPGNISLVQQNSDDPAETKQEDKESTNIYIDMNVDMTPEASIRVLMDRLSGDFISANGTGNLKASYYNKGAFRMFGLYNISKGLYRMSMQEVIRKDFILQNGGVVNFNGNPFQAQLDVKAAYTVNSASLRDLSPTATFTQKTSTRVNCVMNIEGSLMKPSITFDLELPAVSEEDKSMVKSLVATEEQMNMQIIYLLGVGRFYGGEYAQNNGNQTNQAMNSILTSTLSGQFNQMLSQVINSNNWNLGANINPGQNGMNDMEFQTMLQGSLFNNRLLINGNFGYKENVMMNSNFVGDFDVQWLLNNAGTISLKAYNETNDRYFTRNTLNTQGLGIQFRKEFERWSDLFRFSRRKKE